MHPDKISNRRTLITLFVILAGLLLSWYAGHLYSHTNDNAHYGWFSLLPAVLTLSIAWISREPLPALLAGTVSGFLVMNKADYFNDILIASFTSKSSASVLLLYLILLGSLMGIWQKTGASHAFAEFATRKFVRGPRSAKLVAWGLGLVFFQGGTISSVLVGTTVKPVADKQKVSHEELSCIVDATSAPVAIILAFNAWPVYVQAFIGVPGVDFLATEADRIRFFFQTIPLNFYALFSLFATLLLALDLPVFGGSRLKRAMSRARETGELDAPAARPLASAENRKPEKKSGAGDFLIPMFSLVIIALITFSISGSPNVNAAFTIAILMSMGFALYRGLNLHDIFLGISSGFKSVVFGAVVLLLAVAIGQVSQDAGAGRFLVTMIGSSIPWYTLPFILLLLTMIIAFSTGTSWATFAVVFPIAMPLAWEFATAFQLQNPELYMMIIFACCLNGSVFGDQCSPISDTSVLSSMSTGCDLMDHVKSQIPLAVKSMVPAILLWAIILTYC